MTRPVDHLPAPRARPAGLPHALEGLRVLDFTRFLAGPWCTQTLADLGAEVIKIENPPEGDGTRLYRPPEIAGESAYYLGFNRNKRSLALDLKSAAGRGVAADLAARADVLVENFSPGVMDRLGLGYDALAARNPRLVYCSLSAYGADSPLAGQPGFDAVLQAESGLASLSGDPDRQPMRSAAPVVDIATAMNATAGILAALAARGRSGLGQHVEVAMFDTAVSMLAYFSVNYLVSGEEPRRNGNTVPVATPIGMFDTADGGAVYVSCGTQESWERLARRVLGRPDLAEDARFSSHRGRNAHQAELMALLAGVFRSRDRDDWVACARREKVPLGAVRSVGEALHSEAARARGLVSRLPHPAGEGVPNIAPPFRLSATPVADPVAAPALGADRDAVLGGVLGLDAAGIAELAAAGAFGAGGTEGETG